MIFPCKQTALVPFFPLNVIMLIISSANNLLQGDRWTVETLPELWPSFSSLLFISEEAGSLPLVAAPDVDRPPLPGQILHKLSGRSRADVELDLPRGVLLIQPPCFQTPALVFEHEIKFSTFPIPFSTVSSCVCALGFSNNAHIQLSLHSFVFAGESQRVRRASGAAHGMKNIIWALMTATLMFYSLPVSFNVPSIRLMLRHSSILHSLFIFVTFLDSFYFHANSQVCGGFTGCRRVKVLVAKCNKWSDNKCTKEWASSQELPVCLWVCLGFKKAAGRSSSRGTTARLTANAKGCMMACGSWKTSGPEMRMGGGSWLICEVGGNCPC